MTALIQKNIRHLGYGKISALFFGCLLFSLSIRTGSGLTFEQHILSAVSDHYYLTYYMLPLTLLISFSFLEEDGAFVMVRYSSYFSYFCKKWSGSGLAALIIILTQVASVILSGIGLPANNIWTLPAGAVNENLFSVLQQYFKSPFSAFILYTVFQFAGTWILNGLCMWIGHFAGSKQSPAILMALYVEAALWIKIPALQKFPVTGLNHLLILHHNFSSRWRFMITIISTILLIAIILLTVYYFWQTRYPYSFNFNYGLLPYYMRELASKKNFIILCAVVIAITLYKGFKNPYLETGGEWIYFLFAGHGTGYLQSISFLEMLIINSTALYLLAVFIESTVSAQSSFISIRIRRRKDLLNAILAAGALFLLLYCFLWFAGGFIGTCLFGFEFDIKALEYLVCSVVLKFLDLLVQYMAMLMLYVCTKQISAGFIILIGFNLLSIAPLSITKYLPFGLSSMVRITLFDTEPGISVFLAFGILIMSALFLFWWHLTYGYKKLLS